MTSSNKPESNKTDLRSEWFRTHYCKELNPDLDDQEVVVNGWVYRKRDHGNVLFFDVRDRTGLIQSVARGEDGMVEELQDVRQGDCVAFRGTIQKRPDESVNPDLVTGKVEMQIQDFHVFSRTDSLPFSMEEHEESTSYEQRLKYRYLDLRRPEMQDNIMFRHRVVREMRNFFVDRDFIEVETPYLVKNTPGGARKFLVPNRHDPGTFFALAESPQIYKQLLMISGYERYFQIVRCFRDEDLRKDRQPEFTQLDLEMSFVSQEDVIEVVEDCVKSIFQNTMNLEISPPFPRIDFAEARKRFGTDKPDVRFGLELRDISSVVEDGECRIFTQAIEDGGEVRGLTVPGGSSYSRSEIDRLETFVQGYDIPGLAWFRVESEEELDSPLEKFLTEKEQSEIIRVMDAEAGDLLLFVAGETERTRTALGGLRKHVAEKEDMIPEDEFQFLWVRNFPLFEKDSETGERFARHHPFTAPLEQDEELLSTEPDQVRAQAYDLVLNGYEIAGGSIRVHRPSLQEEIFEVLGMSEEEIQEKFSFLLEALNFGAPPHGGIALGLDRFVMVLKQCSSIREVIPFPRTGRAYDPMSDSPSPASEEQLRELYLKLSEEAKDPSD